MDKSNLTSLMNVTASLKQCSLAKAQTISVLASFILVLAVGVIGNSSILFVFIPRLKAGHTLELLIVYLSVCDLLASIFGPGVFIYWEITCNQRWDLGWLGCKIVPAMSRITVDVSISVVLFMVIERCRTIVTPFKKRLHSRDIHIAVASCVVLVILCESYYISAIQITSKGICGVPTVADYKYSVPLAVTTILRGLAFVGIFSTTTTLIIRKLKNSNKDDLLGRFSKKRHDANVRITKMLIAMAAIFSVLVFPRDILHLAYTISWMNPAKEGFYPT